MLLSHCHPSDTFGLESEELPSETDGKREQTVDQRRQEEGARKRTLRAVSETDRKTEKERRTKKEAQSSIVDEKSKKQGETVGC